MSPVRLARLLSLPLALALTGPGLAQGPKPGVTADLAALHREHAAHRAARSVGPFTRRQPHLRVVGDQVTIDAVAAGDPGALLADLVALGLVGGAAHGDLVSGHLPIAAVPALDGLASLQLARPAYFLTHTGAVNSQGDQAARADLARATFGLDGSGVTVGVLSDSFNCLFGAATDVAQGELSPVLVIQDACPGGTDEGRAMLQIVHDVAPGAGLAFATANGGQANFANNILRLRQAGADVIVDDIIYLAEPMFQDGVIAQAVNQVVAAGVPYFSSAGNNGRQAYESMPFRPGTVYAANAFGSFAFRGGTAHDFNPAGGVDEFQHLTIPPGGQLLLVLQWDSPFRMGGSPGSQNDLDVYLLNTGHTSVLASSASPNVNGDPVEILFYDNPSGVPLGVDLMIVKFAGANPGRLRYVLFGSATIDEYATNSGTIYGHANAVGAEAVGAAFFANTPAFDVTPPLLEPFSSAGTTPILFSPSGSPIFDPRDKKPAIVAPDGANTSFFGVDSGMDADGFPNFFGTSASAPHAAAVAALIRQARPALTPAAIYAALETTALDMGALGFDHDTGFGLIRADLALASLYTLTITGSPRGTPNPLVAGGTASLSVSAVDNFNQGPRHSWSASCPTLGGNGAFSNATAPNPTWTAPANPTTSVQSCVIAVTVGPPGLTQTVSYVQGVIPITGLALTLVPNQTSVRAGDTLILTATLTPGPVGFPVDAYLAIRLPDGSFVSIVPEGRANPGLIPIAAGFAPLAITAEVFRYTFTGTEPLGEYTVMAALTQAGTTVVVGGIEQETFQHLP